ncbi:YbaK/EbsC family protein [Leifsonia sp. H3M29-4]|uniref:YbaK/EbsC family protein n=1 Tax=Salinibacterium metalliresistens TaxID=3031321 RepID=UPI0023DC0C98|nr:YbaK/EbsC family protein [Salinibacterium metalliresistens]MDF1479904.1 YbaK/EbsC family protein [Salinibacterium metalliresistens]
MDARAERFASRLAERGILIEPREMDASTHTAAQAAAALGCGVEAIVKSLLFLRDDEPVLVLASGPNRVDTTLLAELLGGEVRMADAKRVKAETGSSIGGVPPLGHPEPLRTVMDETLLRLPVVWAAAASATSVFAIEPARLAELTDATIARVA